MSVRIVRSVRTDIAATLVALVLAILVNLIPRESTPNLGFVALGWPVQSVDLYRLQLADKGPTSLQAYTELLQKKWGRGDIGPNGALEPDGSIWFRLVGRPFLIIPTNVMLNASIAVVATLIVCRVMRARRCQMIRSRIASNRCPDCGYPRTGIGAARCPECGANPPDALRVR